MQSKAAENKKTLSTIDYVSPKSSNLSKKQSIKYHYASCTACDDLCGIILSHDGSKILSVTGDPDDPHSHGYLCTKATEIQQQYEDPRRLTTPLIRSEHQWQSRSWKESLNVTAERLHAIQVQHGDDAVAVYWGKSANQNIRLRFTKEKFQKALGSKNIFRPDTLDQLPHKQIAYWMFGHPNIATAPDLERTAFVLILGSTDNTPSLTKPLEMLSARGLNIMSVSNLTNSIPNFFSEQLTLAPDTEPFFLIGLIQTIIENNQTHPDAILSMVDQWDELHGYIRSHPLDRICQKTGLTAAQFEYIATIFTTSKSAVCFNPAHYKNHPFAAINHWLTHILHIITGNFDRTGGLMFTTPAIFSDASLSAYHQGRYFSRVNQYPEQDGAFPPHLLAEEILTLGAGKIRALITIAGDPLDGVVETEQLKQALPQLEFMVSIDSFMNPTNHQAQMILPPNSPLENEQCYFDYRSFSSKDIIKYSPPMIKPDKSALSDGAILTGLIQRLQALKKPIKGKKPAATPRMRTDLALDYALRTGPYGQLNSNEFHHLVLYELKKHRHGLDLGAFKTRLPDILQTHPKRIQLMPSELTNDVTRLNSTPYA